ncbi:MAG: NADH-quinone oxidoreductase subunit J [Opitutaceae bacterium]
MADFLFYAFAALTLGSALMVALHRNAVDAALSLFLTFFGMAGLFVLLEAYFLAILQVLVYAGAVVVLFAFIVMLLDVDSNKRRPIGKFAKVAAGISLALLGTGVLWLFHKNQLSGPALPLEASGGALKTYGRQLFTTYLLPMQVAGFLLLIAMIGVIAISKKAKAADAAEESRS